MTKINIFRPPKISVDARKSFLNQLLMIIVSIFLRVVLI